MNIDYKEFKDTEIGRIPKEWEVIKIKDVGKVLTGKTPSTTNKMYWNGEIPFITPVDIQETKYVYRTERYVTPQGAGQIGYVLPKDTVLVVCIGSTIGKTSVTYTECITNQQINAIICNDKVNPHYVYYAITLKNEFLKSFSGTAAVPIIKKSLFEEFEIPLPPLPEQKKIADVLSTVDKAIEKVDESIEKTKRLKKGLMQELLTGRRNTVDGRQGRREFKQTEIGMIPKEWKVSELKDVVEINKESRDPMREFSDSSFLYIDIESIENETGVIRRAKRIIGKEAPSRARRLIHYNDVIMSTVRPYLKAFAIVPREYDKQICSTGFAVLTCKERIIPLYLLYILFSKSVIEQCNRMMVGGQYPALNNSQVEKIQLPLPPLPEQKKIAEILDTVDKRLELLRKKKEKLERVKKGFMNDLLSGRKRVKISRQ